MKSRLIALIAMSTAFLLAAAALTLPITAADSSAKAPGSSAKVIRPAAERFANEATTEIPDFQRHVLPLMGRLGCNTRSCHGSFQGRGGFRLSLFGYDFKADHEALLAKDSGRVDLEAPELSKILEKPTLAIPHKGGKRMEADSWAYHLFTKWIEQGAKTVTRNVRFARLDVTPSEIVFNAEGKTIPLKVVAHWADGTAEDVTCISRFRTNDESVAEVNEAGVVTSKGKGDTHVVAFYDNGVAVTQILSPVSDKTGAKYPDVPTSTKIDALVVAKLKKLGIIPSEVCNDSEFLRRVSLDLTGTLPNPLEIEKFLADPSPSKREMKIDELLGRPTYSAWWATKLCDITGDNPKQFAGNILNDRQAAQWYAWIERRIRENTPYDKLVAGIVLATSRKPGQTYEEFIKEQSTYFRDAKPADYSARETMPHYWSRKMMQPEDRALAFSYAFLGVRLECAQCHKHPFDQWTQDDFKSFTAFFNPIRFGIAPTSREKAAALRKELGLDQLKGGMLQREIGKLAKEGKAVPWQEVFVAPGNRPAAAKKKQQAKRKEAVANVQPKLLGGKAVDLSTATDPRKPVMDWMRSKDNPYFARAFVNRVWATDFGRGIVNPPDDMNQANPPGNAPLLDYLAKGFIDHEFDMKWLHREILLSDTYQRSWKTNASNHLDEKNFSRSVLRRLPAEVLIDAAQAATANSKDLAVNSTLAGLQERAIGPKGGASIGRRNGGGDFASKVFGRSPRDTNCDCSASNEPNLLQSIYLQNDGEMLANIDRANGWLNERTGATSKGTENNRTAADQSLVALRKRIKELESQAETFKKAGADREKALKDTELQIAARRDELKKARRRLDAMGNANPTPPTPFDADAVVHEAYLRTLSRKPTEAEAKRAREYLTAGDHAKGMRDLLWALLNTKEFVTNH